MKNLQSLGLMLALLAVAGCGRNDGQGAEESVVEPQAPPADQPAQSPDADTGEAFEIEPGLTGRVLQQGSGETAEPGQTAVVHYTGWLYDEGAPDNRGVKFDSSVDRGEPFVFPLGAGRVIDGWDRGVAGMQVGEVRELTIAPELAYGERGAGDVIPPGATLVFEVELADIEEGGD